MCISNFQMLLPRLGKRQTRPETDLVAHASADDVISRLDVRRAKQHSRIQLAILAGSTVWRFAQLAWFAADGRSSRLKAGIEHRAIDHRLVTPGYFAAAAALSLAANLPVSYAGGYLVERWFGLTRQSSRDWLSEYLKRGAVGIALQTPILSAAFWAIGRRPRDWWLALAAAGSLLATLFSILAPVLLMPLFNRFELLRDDELGRRVQALSDRAGVRVADVFEMNMSRQSEKPNAVFTGIGPTKRIVLGDMLLRDFTPDEIEAIVAHELAHQVHGDIWRLIGFGCGLGFGVSWFLSKIGPPLIEVSSPETRVSEISDCASYPMLSILLTAIGLALLPVQSAFSRRIERRADQFAVDLTGDREAFATALEKLAARSLSDPNPPRLVVTMLSSHPPLAERIHRAKGGAVHSRGGPTCSHAERPRVTGSRRDALD